MSTDTILGVVSVVVGIAGLSQYLLPENASKDRRRNILAAVAIVTLTILSTIMAVRTIMEDHAIDEVANRIATELANHKKMTMTQLYEAVIPDDVPLVAPALLRLYRKRQVGFEMRPLYVQGDPNMEYRERLYSLIK